MHRGGRPDYVHCQANIVEVLPGGLGGHVGALAQLEKRIVNELKSAVRPGDGLGLTMN